MEAQENFVVDRASALIEALPRIDSVYVWRGTRVMLPGVDMAHPPPQLFRSMVKRHPALYLPVAVPILQESKD